MRPEDRQHATGSIFEGYRTRGKRSAGCAFVAGSIFNAQIVVGYANKPFFGQCAAADTDLLPTASIGRENTDANLARRWRGIFLYEASGQLGAEEGSLYG